MATTFRDKDNGASTLLKVTQQFHRGIQGIRVGIVGVKAGQIHANSDLTNAELAFIHTYGLGVPRRDFIVAAAIEAEKNIMVAYQHGNRKMMSMIKQGNKNVQAIVKAGLEEARKHLEDVMKDYIRSGKVDPPTQDGGTPLYKTGQLVDAISAYIETKDGQPNPRG